MLASVLFGVANNWKQPKCPRVEEYTHCWRMYTAEYAPQQRRTPATCMADVMLRKKPEAKEHRVWFHLHKGQEQIRGFHGDSRTWAVLGGMDGKVLDGEYGVEAGHKVVHIYQNLSNCSLEICAFHCNEWYLSEETQTDHSVRPDPQCNVQLSANVTGRRNCQVNDWWDVRCRVRPSHLNPQVTGWSTTRQLKAQSPPRRESADTGEHGSYQSSWVNVQPNEMGGPEKQLQWHRQEANRHVCLGDAL